MRYKKLLTFIIAVVSIMGSTGAMGSALPTGASQVMKHANASGSMLYGFRYSDKSLCSISLDGSATQLWTSDYSERAGFVTGDSLVAFNMYAPSYTKTAYYEIYDLKSGQLVKGQTTLNTSNYQQCIFTLAYDAETKTAYCFSYGTARTGNRCFQKIDCSDMSQNLKSKFTVLSSSIGSDNVPMAMTYNAQDKNIYGLMENGDLVTISKTDGSLTVVGATSVTPNYSRQQALGYSPNDKCIVWLGVPSGDTQAHVYTIDPASAKAVKTGDLGDQEQYSFVVTTDKMASAGTPSSPSVTAHFEKASLEGTLSITMPSVTVEGNAITGTVHAAVAVDGKEQADVVSGEAGATVTYAITLTEGSHEITVTPYLNTGARVDGQKATLNVYAGNDKPQTPQNVKLKTNAVSWDAVSGTGVNGGYVDAAAISYNVYLADSLVATTTTTTAAIEPLTSVRRNYTAYVTATANGKTSDKGASNVLPLGESLKVPFTITPTDDEYDLCTILDANKDGKTWELTDTTEVGNSIYYNGSTVLTASAADDWFFLPVAQFLSVKKTFIFSLDVKNNGNIYYPEKFEVKIGKDMTPEDMTSIMDTVTIKSKKWTNYSKEFAVPDAGEYYIGIHCVSDEDMWCLFARNFKVTESENSSASPDSVTNLRVECAELGELKAKVSFTMPTTDRKGNALDTTKTLTAKVSSSVAETTVQALPGAAVNTEVDAPQGNDTITVVISNDSGMGLANSAAVYCGLDKPKAATLTGKISDDNMSVTISWNAPTEGYTGHYVDPAKVYYKVELAIGSGSMEIIDIVEPNETLQYTYTYDSPDDATEQNKYSLAVVPYIPEVDGGKGAEASYFHSMLGKPYAMPMVENFDTWHFAYNPIMIMAAEPGYDATWTYAETSGAEGLPDAAVADQFAMFCYYPTATAGMGKIMLPKFTPKEDGNDRISVYVYNYQQMPKVDILLEGYDIEPEIVYTIDKSQESGWMRYYFQIPEKFKTQPWLDIQVKTTFEATDGYFLLGGYAVEDAPDTDLAISKINGSVYGRVGDKHNYTVDIVNDGVTPMTLGKVTMTVTKDEEQILCNEVEANKELTVGEHYEAPFTFTPDADVQGTLFVTFAIDSDDDVASNNTYETYVTVVNGRQPFVTDLAGTAEGTGVSLSWTEPKMPQQGYEDFEGLSPFTYGSTLGDWLNIDKDGLSLCYSENLEVPDAGKPKAWQVQNHKLLGGRGLLVPYEGDQCLMAFCPENGYRANDWLISPEVKPGSMLKFHSCTVSCSYPEELQVLASSTDRETGSFTVVEDEITDSLAQWTEHSIQLPEDAKYFAIRYRSPDEFGIMLDAIEYSPVAEVAKITGYNVYRDGIKVAENISGTSYADNDLAEGTYKYNVTALVKEGDVTTEERMSNTAVVTKDSSGIEMIQGTDSPSGAMYNVAGQRVKASTRGIVIVNNKKFIK